jgi:phosphotransferase system IIB component
MFCPPQASDAVECPAGSYCSEPQYMKQCPSGYFCRGADIEPVKCSFYQSCPEGTHVPSGSAKSGIFLLIFLLATVEFIRFRNQKSSRRIQAEKHMTAVRKRGESAAFGKDFAKLLAAASGPSQRNLKIEHNIESGEVETGGFEGFVHLNPDPTPIKFEFKDLSLVLKSGQKIIDHVSGRVEAGKMTAIMGPSGCGKTTMLNVLRNKVRRCEERSDNLRKLRDSEEQGSYIGYDSTRGARNVGVILIASLLLVLIPKF